MYIRKMTTWMLIRINLFILETVMDESILYRRETGLSLSNKESVGNRGSTCCRDEIGSCNVQISLSLAISIRYGEKKSVVLTQQN